MRRSPSFRARFAWTTTAIAPSRSRISRPSPRNGFAAATRTIRRARATARPGSPSVPPASLSPGFLYTYIVKAVDPDGDRLTYELLQAPGDMTIDPKVGQIVWIVPPAGVAGSRWLSRCATSSGPPTCRPSSSASPQTPEDPTKPEPPQGRSPSRGPDRRLSQPLRAAGPGLYERRPHGARSSTATSTWRVSSPARAISCWPAAAIEPLYYEPSLNDSARSHAAGHGPKRLFPAR